MTLRWNLLLIIGLIVAVQHTSVFAALHEPLPLDHWAYPLLTQLIRRHSLVELRTNVRPSTRGQIAQSLLQADSTATDDPVVHWLLTKLNEEFQAERRLLRGLRQGQSGEWSVAWGGEGNRTDQGVRSSVWVGVDVARGVSLFGRVEGLTADLRDPAFAGAEKRFGLTARVREAGVAYQTRWMGVIFGRQRIAWGPVGMEVGWWRNGLEGRQLLISGWAPSFDQMSIWLRYKTVTITMLQAMLDASSIDESPSRQYVNRYLALHRLEWRPRADLVVGLSDGALYTGVGRPVEWYYLNPLIPVFESVSTNPRRGEAPRGDNDNIVMMLDVSWWLRRMELYGEVLVDEFQYEQPDRRRFHDALGRRFGLVVTAPLTIRQMDVGVEYLRNDRWLYIHPGLFTRYLYHGIILGTPLGGDVEQVVGWMTYQLTRDLAMHGAGTWRRRGETEVVTTPWQVGKDRGFPFGVVERTWEGRVGMTYHPLNNLVGTFGMGYDRTRNAGHRPGDDERMFMVSFSIAYTLDLAL
ncbi:MAG: hypothetical protein HY709_03580 [Candidatus Latescibacteria bacterium]|nr:hypothetical protein [Candidatus Latescibacterota bacterium]